MGGSSDAPANGDSKSSKKSNATSSSRPDAAAAADSKQTDLMKAEVALNSEASKPLAPPPKPGQAQGNDTPDYFSSQVGGSLSLEPNPFEQSFGGSGQPETPGGTKLPSVAALTSPSSLIPGTGTTPFNWPGGSLRTGPLSPAMLSGPTNDYFGDHHIRGGFPTPNESSLRTGLTPGGSGSMFPAPSPNSALLAQLATSGATPGTLEFHRTALSAKRELQHASAKGLASTSDSNDVALSTSKAESKAASGPFDPHDNDAANGLYMLAQGSRNGPQASAQYPPASQPAAHAHPAPIAPQAIDTSPQMASINGGSIGSGGSIRGVSEVSGMSEESDQPKPTTRGKGRKNANSAATTNGRRKADDSGTGRTPKKAKGNSGSAMINGDLLSDDDKKDDSTGGANKSKMTDEEKRKNFLERNRVAALKCRQRKKQWLQNLQAKVEVYSAENENLSTQIAQLREEVVNLKTLLLAHKDCPVTQQQALQQGGVPILQVVEPFNQMNPYGMATTIANGAVIGQPVQRRFS